MVGVCGWSGMGIFGYVGIFRDSGMKRVEAGVDLRCRVWVRDILRLGKAVKGMYRFGVGL